jgi:phosphate-selective porin OprO/OprP
VELFAPKRHRGLMGSYDNDFMLAALGAFVGSVEDGADNTGNATQDDDVWVAGRLGGFFQPEKNKVAYVGGAVAWQNSNDGAAARFRVRPARSHVTSTRLIDTGNLANIDDITRFNVETFLEYERVYVQAEYLRADVGRTAGLSDLDFNGWYVTVGAFVWGDGELYRPFKGGETSRPKVYNALELVASYDTADLTDGTLIGGEQDSWVVGATWWFNPYVKLMANYAKSDVERPGNIADNEEPGVFMMRVALEY